LTVRLSVVVLAAAVSACAASAGADRPPQSSVEVSSTDAAPSSPAPSRPATPRPTPSQPYFPSAEHPAARTATQSVQSAAPTATARAGTNAVPGRPEASDPVRGAVIVLDPGHNGGNAGHPAEIGRLVDVVTQRKACDTTGTQTVSGYPEWAFTLDVARRMATLLTAAGARVVLTRTSNEGWGPCITERAAIGNRSGAAAALSIHADGGPVSGRGFHVIKPALVSGHNDAIIAPSARLGALVRSAYRDGTGLPFATYAGVAGTSVRNDLGGLNLSRVPKVFIECGNMRNAADAALLSDSNFRQRIARALTAGMTRFLRGDSTGG
jgi:N-acetylmuramoyl-L-alanine amidase